MGNGDVASVNAQREYMGNVTVLVNKKSPHMCSVYKSRRAGVLKGGGGGGVIN